MAKMSRENDENHQEEIANVHEIKFDEYGIMDDGLEESTHTQLKHLEGECHISFPFFNFKKNYII